MSEQGNACAVSVIANTQCSVLIEIAPYALQFSATLFCVFVLLWTKIRDNARKKPIDHAGCKSCSKRIKQLIIRAFTPVTEDAGCLNYQLWQQLKSHFLTSSQSPKHSTFLLWERAAIGTHVWKKTPAGEVQQPEIECLRELGFRSHCCLNYFHSWPRQCPRSLQRSPDSPFMHLFSYVL